MQTLPHPRVPLSNGAAVSLRIGFTKALAAAARDLTSVDAKSDGDPVALCQAAAIRLADVRRSLKALESERAALKTALAALEGEDFEESDHPVVRACAEIKSQADVFREADPGLRAVDLGEVKSELAQTIHELNEERKTVESRLHRLKKQSGRLLARSLATPGTDVDDLEKTGLELPAGYEDLQALLTRLKSEPMNVSTMDPLETDPGNINASFVCALAQKLYQRERGKFLDAKAAREQLERDLDIREIKQAMQEHLT